MIWDGVAPGATTCRNEKPCWRAKRSGFLYTDRATTRRGIKKVDLKAGDEGKARLSFQAKGIEVDLPARALQGVITVQLHASDGGAPLCWEASYSTPRKNDPQTYRARSD